MQQSDSSRELSIRSETFHQCCLALAVRQGEQPPGGILYHTVVGGFRVLGEKESLVNVEGRYITSVQAQIQSVRTRDDISTPECHNCASARGTQMPNTRGGISAVQWFYSRKNSWKSLHDGEAGKGQIHGRQTHPTVSGQKWQIQRTGEAQENKKHTRRAKNIEKAWWLLDNGAPNGGLVGGP